MNRWMERPLYIIGAGGFGREVAWIVERINENAIAAMEPCKGNGRGLESIRWDLKGFVDDDEKLWNASLNGYEVLGGISALERVKEDVWCVLAIGNSDARTRGVERLRTYPHVHFATLVDPAAVVGGSVSVGAGSVICAGSVVTVNAKIGEHCIVNLDCTIGHDVELDSFVTLHPSVNVSGCVKIGARSEIGTGSQVIQGLHIGARSIIGAGSAVIRDVEDEVVAAGSPAKAIKKRLSP